MGSEMCIRDRHILEALDASHPCWERTESTSRALVRIEALLAAGRSQDALLELESRAPGFDPLGAAQVSRLRARALQGAGLLDEASRAWLLVARDESGAARARAFQTAAELAAEAQDDLGVLYVARDAQAAGLGPVVASLELAARERLGIAAPPADVAPPAELRLQRAERWLELDDQERAAAEFETLYEERTQLALDPLSRARVVLGWARCVSATRGIEAAAGIAAEERARLDEGEAKKHLDLGMARLFEEHGLFERAADAYQGDY